ncbi:MAG: DnaJ domain-containing protein [Thermoanaerobaculia bacterium]|nr:DnaJ domain-containing protein [Thermoanaerobaculia bacterium]
MEFKDYYQTLNVARTATPEEIQKAYRKLARKFHPDVSKEPQAETRFKEIAEAYEVLKDADKRQKYDQFGQAWQARQAGGAPGQPPPGFEGYSFDFGDLSEMFGGRGASAGASGFSNFFEMLFGAAGPGGGRPGAGEGSPRPWASWSGEGRGGWARPGANQEVPLALSLEEAARGGLRELALRTPDGETRTVRVNLPKGIRPGQSVRVPGKGGGGRGGGPAGDLLLRIEVLPHPRFRLEGTHLITTLDISPWEAALGGEADLRTLDGQVRIRIPAGTSSGRRVRVRGRGFPAGKSSEAGDLIAELRVVVPEKLSEKEKELFEQLRTASAFQPRGGK